MKKWGTAAIGLAVIVVVVGWVMTAAGSRFGGWLPDPFAGFTHHEWGALLGGLVGAALSAGIALMVLRRTLSAQALQFRASQAAAEEAQREQLEAQRRALDEQLAAQSAALEEQLAHQAQSVRTQLEAQSNEASKQRELAARAELISIIQLFRRSELDPETISSLGLAIDTGLEKWKFELHAPEDEPLWEELDAWRGIFEAHAERLESAIEAKARVGANTFLMKTSAAMLLDALIRFRRTINGTKVTAEEAARRLREYRTGSLKGLDAL